MPKNILVVGASRGIGSAVAQHFSQAGHWLWTVSRSQPAVGEWIQADLSSPDGIRKVAEQIGDGTPLDALLYMGGVWEKGAFTGQYRFADSSDAETCFVIAVNTIAPIELTRQLAKNLSLADNPRVIVIGALSGLDNSATVEVANTASKFGLRGAVQAMKLSLGAEGIGVTCINPGNIATEEVLDDIEAGRFAEQVPIPLTDLISGIEWLLSLSKYVDVGDLNLQQRAGRC